MWVDNYLLKAKPLPCTGLELYGARCEILHAFTAASDLSRQGRVRPVIYAWGKASARDLQEASDALNPSLHVAIHVSYLFEAFRLGLADYLEELEADSARAATARANAGLWITPLSKDIVSNFLAQRRAKSSEMKECAED